jgi:hypothetical protein
MTSYEYASLTEAASQSRKVANAGAGLRRSGKARSIEGYHKNVAVGGILTADPTDRYNTMRDAAIVESLQIPPFVTRSQENYQFDT